MLVKVNSFSFYSIYYGSNSRLAPRITSASPTLQIANVIQADNRSVVISVFKNSLIIHKEIKQSYQRIGSRAYTFKTGNTLSV